MTDASLRSIAAENKQHLLENKDSKGEVSHHCEKAPARAYLEKCVMDHVTDGLQYVLRLRPKHPILTLEEYLRCAQPSNVSTHVRLGPIPLQSSSSGTTARNSHPCTIQLVELKPTTGLRKLEGSYPIFVAPIATTRAMESVWDQLAQEFTDVACVMAEDRAIFYLGDSPFVATDLHQECFGSQLIESAHRKCQAWKSHHTRSASFEQEKGKQPVYSGGAEFLEALEEEVCEAVRSTSKKDMQVSHQQQTAGVAPASIDSVSTRLKELARKKNLAVSFLRVPSGELRPMPYISQQGLLEYLTAMIPVHTHRSGGRSRRTCVLIIAGADRDRSAHAASLVYVYYETLNLYHATAMQNSPLRISEMSGKYGNQTHTVRFEPQSVGAATKVTDGTLLAQTSPGPIKLKLGPAQQPTFATQNPEKGSLAHGGNLLSTSQKRRSEEEVLERRRARDRVRAQKLREHVEAESSSNLRSEDVITEHHEMRMQRRKEEDARRTVILNKERIRDVTIVQCCVRRFLQAKLVKKIQKEQKTHRSEEGQGSERSRRESGVGATNPQTVSHKGGRKNTASLSDWNGEPYSHLRTYRDAAIIRRVVHHLIQCYGSEYFTTLRLCRGFNQNHSDLNGGDSNVEDADTLRRTRFVQRFRYIPSADAFDVSSEEEVWEVNVRPRRRSCYENALNLTEVVRCAERRAVREVYLDSEQFVVTSGQQYRHVSPVLRRAAGVLERVAQSILWAAYTSLSFHKVVRVPYTQWIVGETLGLALAWFDQAPLIMQITTPPGTVPRTLSSVTASERILDNRILISHDYVTLLAYKEEHPNASSFAPLLHASTSFQSSSTTSPQPPSGFSPLQNQNPAQMTGSHNSPIAKATTGALSSASLQCPVIRIHKSIPVYAAAEGLTIATIRATVSDLATREANGTNVASNLKTPQTQLLESSPTHSAATSSTPALTIPTGKASAVPVALLWVSTTPDICVYINEEAYFYTPRRVQYPPNIFKPKSSGTNPNGTVPSSAIGNSKFATLSMRGIERKKATAGPTPVMQMTNTVIDALIISRSHRSGGAKRGGTGEVAQRYTRDTPSNALSSTGSGASDTRGALCAWWELVEERIAAQLHQEILQSGGLVTYFRTTPSKPGSLEESVGSNMMVHIPHAEATMLYRVERRVYRPAPTKRQMSLSKKKTSWKYNASEIGASKVTPGSRADGNTSMARSSFMRPEGTSIMDVSAAGTSAIPTNLEVLSPSNCFQRCFGVSGNENEKPFSVSQSPFRTQGSPQDGLSGASANPIVGMAGEGLVGISDSVGESGAFCAAQQVTPLFERMPMFVDSSNPCFFEGIQSLYDRIRNHIAQQNLHGNDSNGSSLPRAPQAANAFSSKPGNNAAGIPTHTGLGITNTSAVAALSPVVVAVQTDRFSLIYPLLSAIVYVVETQQEVLFTGEIRDRAVRAEKRASFLRGRMTPGSSRAMAPSQFRDDKITNKIHQQNEQSFQYVPSESMRHEAAARSIPGNNYNRAFDSVPVSVSYGTIDSGDFSLNIPKSNAAIKKGQSPDSSDAAPTVDVDCPSVSSFSMASPVAVHRSVEREWLPIAKHLANRSPQLRPSILFVNAFLRETGFSEWMIGSITSEKTSAEASQTPDEARMHVIQCTRWCERYFIMILFHDYIANRFAANQLGFQQQHLIDPTFAMSPRSALKETMNMTFWSYLQRNNYITEILYAIDPWDPDLLTYIPNSAEDGGSGAPVSCPIPDHLNFTALPTRWQNWSCVDDLH